jgi:hypothetical protein
MHSWLHGYNAYRVNRWYIFIPKIPILVYFGGHWHETFWYILWPFEIGILQPFGTFYGHLDNFEIIWYIFPLFG